MASKLHLAAVACLVMAGSSAPAAADAVSDFYHGKTLTVIVGYGPGGGFDQYARLVGTYLPRYLPGHPDSIVQNMPGASTVKATKYILNVAPKDGTVIGIPNHNLFFDQVLERGKLGFDMTKLEWIGRLGTRLSVGMVSAKSGVTSIAEAKNKPLTMAATGPTGGAVMIPAAFNNLLGTKFKTVTGYSGQTEMYLAFERGEVDGMATAVWEDLKSGAQSEWMKDKRVNLLYVVANERVKDLPNVPALPELAENADQRKILELLTAADVIGRAFYVAPEVPQARVTALRTAFMAMTKDPELLAEAKKRNVEIDPMPGEKLAAFLKQVDATPAPLVDKLRHAVAKP